MRESESVSKRSKTKRDISKRKKKEKKKKENKERDWIEAKQTNGKLWQHRGRFRYIYSEFFSFCI